MQRDPERPLPRELVDDVTDILFREPAGAAREALLSALIANHPEHGAALSAYLERENHRAAHSLPATFGPFRILERLGQGGFGTVYKAQQVQGVERVVALKVVHSTVDSRAALARFDLERQVLATLNHDAIARFHEAGQNDGCPWFSMELVEGRPLTEHCDEHRLGIAERIGLLLQVCAGVQHAHDQGIVHRDLKPGNVLVSKRGSVHTVKIIDFGIARAAEHKLHRSLQTMFGMVLGTPEYMAPEQCGGDPLTIDPRADIYALGVLLYEQLTGALPFVAAELPWHDLVAVQQVLQQKDPLKPSTRIATLRHAASAAVQRRQPSIKSWCRSVRGDLDAIVGRAMEKDRNRRYQSVAAFADDLRRHLEHRPIVAQPPSRAYRLSKFVRRHRGRLLAGSTILLTALGGVLATVHYREQASTLTRENSLLGKREQAARTQAERSIEEFQQLAAGQRIRRAIETARELDPAWPDRIPAMRRWLQEAAALLDMRPRLRATIDELRTRAAPSAPAGAGDWPSPATAEGRAAQFLHTTLIELLEALEALANREKLQVENRLRWATQLSTAIDRHPKARTSWTKARAAIAKADGIVASTLYADAPIALPDETVVGLVPIGMNPVTKLWEFYDLRSAWDGELPLQEIAIPEHDAQGRIQVEDSTGIVFVLLPGAAVLLGSSALPKSPHYDPQHEADEPLHIAEVAPFLMARHEMTQGQWRRLLDPGHERREPSYYAAGRTVAKQPITLRNPVEQVDWEESQRLLHRHGMTLPSEDQWEYACRAGTTDVWWATRVARDLRGKANVLDAAARREPDSGPPEAFDDRHAVHAPVGSFTSNDFGLFDVHGNVWEWCAPNDANSSAMLAASESTAPSVGTIVRPRRGGSFLSPARAARAAARVDGPIGLRASELGLRPARLLPVPAGTRGVPAAPTAAPEVPAAAAERPELDVVVWTPQATPPTTPSPAARYLPGMVFAQRAGTLLFGGRCGTDYQADTWLYDGNRWTAVPTPAAPSAREGASLVAIPAGDIVLLFGGEGPGHRPLGDLWEFSGQVWTPRETAAVGPSPRAGHAMAWSAATQCVVLFGGYGPDGNLLGDTWRYEVTRRTWTEANGIAPRSRAAHAMAGDPATGSVVLFGGRLEGPDFVELGDTWSFDGSRWRVESPLRPSPPPRYLATLVADPARHALLLYGGWHQGSCNDLWQWRHGRWQPLGQIHAPTRRHAHGAAFDPVRRRLVVYGGHAEEQGYRADTWEGALLGEAGSKPQAPAGQTPR